MTLAILYASKYGATREAAEQIAGACIAAGLSQTDVQTLDIARSPDLPEADVVLIGAPVYGGSIPRSVSRFVEANLDTLLERRVGLFLSCLYEDARAEQQLADNFPPRLITHSFGHYYVGGRVTFDRLRWLDRVVMKKVAGVDHDVDKLRTEEFERIARDVVSAQDE
ncbi:MAG: flavodoxin domain-containing protein [Spirochaetota bacterium]